VPKVKRFREWLLETFKEQAGEPREALA